MAPAAASGIAISSVVPSDIPGGAPRATLAAAAKFAWQEFIALNWPAVGNPRDTPNNNMKFGQPGFTGPLVWQTFRHKVEIFPGQGTPPGYSQGAPNYGYDVAPQYIYGTAFPNGQVPPCPGQTPVSQPAWVNLDENSQIGLDQMYAGASASSPVPGQEILFLAKANRADYQYVASNGWYNGTAPLAATARYVTTNKQDPTPGNSKLVSFRNGTIEIKTAWRRLTTKEAGNGHFQTGTVRFYETNGSNACYREEVWGMLALHVEQKTPTAPYFIFATFGQADNMLDPQGNPIEDVNGKLLENQTATPMNPAITSQNAVSANPPTTSSVQQLSPQTVTCTPGSSLYYKNTPNPVPPPPAPPTGLPQGQVCIQRRTHNIPDTIIAANASAHAAIAAYNQQNGIKSSPWSYYKLVNVQYKPINKPTPGKDYTGLDAATYYQANIVVETDYNLQVFSGHFQQEPPKQGQPANGCTNVVPDLLITDFNCNGTPFYNVYFNKTQNNMGGCMGCHGNAQVGGSDFSFILSGGPVTAPEPAGPAGVAAAQKRFAAIFHRQGW